MDRNTQRRDFKRLGLLSLSARRAWIEILSMGLDGRFKLVALRKESVDRNFMSAFDVLAVSGRSPQGERG